MPVKRKPQPYIFRSEPKREWSEYQKEIFKNIRSGEKNTIIVARAGSAKTTSLVEGSKFLPKGKKALFCAFNKSIQEELKTRLGSYIECSTLHSLGFRGIKHKFPSVKLNNNKCWNIVETFFSDPRTKYDLIFNIVKAIDLCKASLIDTPVKIEELIFNFGIDTCDEDLDQFIKYVCLGLRKCKEQTNEIDFNDMVWFPFIYNINCGKYDYVFIDESQDLNRCQLELALASKNDEGRVIAVLDDYQAIYSWRGADSSMLDTLKERLSPTELTLPISYRCPKKIIEVCQKYVPDIQAYEKAIDGEIIHLQIDKLTSTAKPGDVVISRLNAPLIKNCLRFIRAGIPANILGRDIGEGLKYMIKKSDKSNIEDFLKWLEVWERDERKRILAKNPKANTDYISDKVECLENFCEDAKDLNEVKKNIDKLFEDKDHGKIVLFATIFKFKGSERDNVFVLNYTLNESSQEEINIKYVSYSRAKKILYLVEK